MDNNKKGSIQEFDTNWNYRKETLYNHWTDGKPKNQIQLAFRNHWLLFQELMEGEDYRTCLEVGCGRGSISSYFSEYGFTCALLDSSAHALTTAKDIFKNNGHSGHFIQGNALSLPFKENSFDVLVSIGLFEHFQDVELPIQEQFRVLKPGGMFFGYVVPEKKDNVQLYFGWINKILSMISQIISRNKKEHAQKSEIFRSNYGSEHYMPFVSSLDVDNIIVSGVYPLPMISHSPEFPFSLLPSKLEIVLTKIFETNLFIRRILLRDNPWKCRETFGQAFLVVFKKVKE